MKKARIIDIDFEVTPEGIVFKAGDNLLRISREKFLQLFDLPKTDKTFAEKKEGPELSETMILEILRLQKLGVDSIDLIARILNIEGDRLRSLYDSALNRYDFRIFDDRLANITQGDYCKRPANFVSARDNPAAVQMRQMRLGGETRSMSAIPNIARIAQFLRQGKNLEEIGATMQFDKRDFARWISEHTFLIDFLSKS
jgi:hypothetical protein